MGKPVALDLAVTSGLQSVLIKNTLLDGSFATSRYENFKCTFLDTKQHCREEGIDFIPMCIEASGGTWGQQALSFFHHIAKTSARLSGDVSSIKLQQTLQSL